MFPPKHSLKQCCQYLTSSFSAHWVPYQRLLGVECKIVSLYAMVSWRERERELGNFWTFESIVVDMMRSWWDQFQLESHSESTNLDQNWSSEDGIKSLVSRCKLGKPSNCTRKPATEFRHRYLAIWVITTTRDSWVGEEWSQNNFLMYLWKSYWGNWLPANSRWNLIHYFWGWI